jgi:flagella basal body P-ring formation protein FlgA
MTVSRADVALARPVDTANVSPHRTENPLRKLEDAIGQVVRRPLREGQILTPSMIEAPTLVRRGETVTVIALAGGIRIETVARAKQAGTEGELIYVETLDTREPFAAQVSGAGEVQIIGR